MTILSLKNTWQLAALLVSRSAVPLFQLLERRAVHADSLWLSP